MAGRLTGRADPNRRPMVPHHRASPLRPAIHPATPDVLDPASLDRFTGHRDGRPTAIDLFCGAGGLSLGLERAGVNVLRSVALLEHDEPFDTSA